MEADDDSPTSTDYTRAHDEHEIRHQIAPKIALVVHLALAFFTILFALTIIGCVIIVEQFGFIIFLAIVLLCSIFLGTIYFVGHLLLEDEKLKRARHTVRQWHEVAKAVVVEEMRLFKSDFQEQFLLMDVAVDPAAYDNYANSYTHEGSDDVGTRQRRKKRSVVFGMLLVPFGGIRERRKKKKEAKRLAKMKQHQGGSSVDGNGGDVDGAGSFAGHDKGDIELV